MSRKQTKAPGGQKRRRGRHRGTEARANSDVTAHLASLGLETPEQYRAWCRRHSLSGALTKTWQERRHERALARQDDVTAAADRQVDEHIAALGLDSVEAYSAWCGQHDLTDSLHKSARQRQKELDLHAVEKSEAALSSVRRLNRRPADTIAAIFARQIAPGDLKTEYLRLIGEEAVRAEANPAAREALLELLLHVEKRGQLLDSSPAVSRLGAHEGNTFVRGLAALAGHADHWIRPVKAWRPKSHNPQRQFGTLARHLLAQYDVPAFMDTAWFHSDPTVARRQQEWFRHIGDGQNIRTADIPVTLTRKMAHVFLEAPDEFTVEEALRWGQIVGPGGDESLARAVNATRLGESFADEDFWGTVVHWLVRHPMLDPECIGPIVDFIHHQKYEPVEAAAGVDAPEVGTPAQPNFSMKSRSAIKLLRQVEEWHAVLAKETRVPPSAWEPSGIGEYAEIERDPESGESVHWSIRELTTTKELNAEGRAMHHCVRSYAANCRRGKVSVFSLQVAMGAAPGSSGDRIGPRAPTRVTTIAVNTRTRQITQVRGRYNALPSGRFEPHQKKRGMDSVYRACLRRSRGVLHQWAETENLTWGRRA